MSYASYEGYKALYGEALPESDYNRLSWEAAREIDFYTTGVDGVKKLKTAFPTDEDNAEAVRRCECALVHLMAQIEAAEKAQREAAGYVEREDGSLQGKVVSSVSSGSESISYSVKNAGTTAIDTAVSDQEARKALFADTVRKYLSGVSDGNEVNLLYLGAYPHV